MNAPVATNDPTAVEAEVQRIYLEMFPEGDPVFVSRAFGWIVDCFTGRYADYQAIDARYHDLEHTMQGTLCMVRLLHGRHKAGAHPMISHRLFKLGLLAILMHDTGYLKKQSDREGTGAKYTAIHVERSAEFAGHVLTEKGFTREDIRSVQNMICCTGVDAALQKIPFQDEAERIVGYALGTADLLGQMAADDYVMKLPILYSEFAEAARFNSNKEHFISPFSSADDLMRKTPGFWQKFVLPRLEKDFSAVHQFLNNPLPHGSNDYVNRIERNIEQLREQLARAV